MMIRILLPGSLTHRVRRFNEIDPNEYRYRLRYLKPGLGWYGNSSYKVNVMLSSTQIEKFQLSFYSWSLAEVEYLNFQAAKILTKGQYISKQITEVLVSPKNERNIARIPALNLRAEILAIFRLFCGRNNDFINLFWDLLTFKPCLQQIAGNIT